MTTIFDTDQRLRDLMQVEPIVRHAGTLARFEGNDTEALIVALLALSDAKRMLTAELAKCHERTSPPEAQRHFVEV